MRSLGIARVRCSRNGFNPEEFSIFELIETDDDCRSYEAEKEAGYAIAAQAFIASIIPQENGKVSPIFANALKNVYAISLGDDLKEMIPNG